MVDTQARILYRGPWQVAYRAVHVLCSDGRRRSVRLTREPDTFFTIPGSVTVRGRTVSGYLTRRETGDETEDWEFRRVDYGKNAALLPPTGF